MFKGSSRLLTGTQKRFWMQKYMQQPSFVSAQMRSFSSGHHDDHHDEHHDDHGHHVEKADPDHKFIASDVNKRFLFFQGMRATEGATVVVENPYRHHNDLPLLQ